MIFWRCLLSVIPVKRLVAVARAGGLNVVGMIIGKVS